VGLSEQLARFGSVEAALPSVASLEQVVLAATFGSNQRPGTRVARYSSLPEGLSQAWVVKPSGRFKQPSVAEPFVDFGQP